ncbi:putative PQ loop repeat family protein [Monocercomonoides exilis]|uniref:putative PQ loop repeat family protein n=1 Tax=Monocercomonoides exilis TaxID=2049356 RepID=UPI003559D2C8|nr:putative PQ loop repeat family protein [Monocercomonoides exilis]|eukprot:MONOS_6649.1-p1 / transcript=MONOS_6649.1 / gene=MONOS_6649 / organism=Monocercomonoides_exilis_PA203 / gene_product=transmembrane protein / transcript_product=transmembrane protein / location=Mono_scaffold00213:45977-46973(-) / protein_length=233 / sequence_SO=supercontig / SO=protein_coding / is_pseudo=false
MKTETRDLIAKYCGYTSTGLGVVQYLPQIYLNFKNKSTTGVSFSSMIIKFIGFSFQFVNGYLANDPTFIIAYAFFMLLESMILFYQFAMYRKDKKYAYFGLFAMPGVPYVLSILYPQAIPYFPIVKPLVQIFSHIPQLQLCIKQQSVKGISLTGQKLNFLNGLFGLMSLSLSSKDDATSSFISYFFSVLSAGSILLLAWLFKKNEEPIKSEKKPKKPKNNSDKKEEIERKKNN